MTQVTIVTQGASAGVQPRAVPVLGVAAPSGTGKTSLLKAVIPLLVAQGLRIGLLKHAHHGFDLDHPGKDSYELRHAGACQVLVASPERWALVTENPRPAEPDLASLLARFDGAALDLVLVEGFKEAPIPKLELIRPQLGRPPLYPQDPDVIAIATDGALPAATRLPVLDLNDPPAVARFILDWTHRPWNP